MRPSGRSCTRPRCCDDEAARRALSPLAELYAFYEGAEPMPSNVLRDLHMEVVQRQYAQLLDYMEAAHGVLMSGRRLRGRRRDTVRAAVGHAIAFTTWRSLVREQGCTTPEAVDMLCRFVAP